MTDELWKKIGTMCYQAAGDAEGIVLRIERGAYADGNTAIRVVNDNTGESFAMLSTNIGDERLPDGEFYLKHYAGNEDLAEIFVRIGITEPVEDAPKYFTGFVEVSRYRIVE